MKPSLLLAAALVGPALSQAPPTTSPPTLDPGTRSLRAESPVVAVEVASNTHDLYLLAPDLASAELVEVDLEFLPLILGGARAIDAHRLDRPRQQEASGEPQWIALPDGGVLLRASRGDRVGILHVPAFGPPRWAVAFDGVTHAADLLETVSVSTDGRWLACATAPDLGGNVLRADLLRPGAPVDLTASLDELTIDPLSLRSTPVGVWFLAGGELWSSDGVAAQQVDTARLPGETLHGDLIPSDEGRHLAVVAEAVPAERRVLVASQDGAVVPVTGAPQPIELPGTGAPLGPYMALAPDGSRLAWLTDGPPQELKIAQVVAQPVETHVTQLPDFPIYIDNIGIIGFASPTQVCYLAGDVVLATVDEDDLIGVADMYATTTTTDGVPTTWNLTRTSGLVWPPFTVPATLSVKTGLLDATGERFLLVEEQDETFNLLGFPIYSGGYYHSSSNMEALLVDLEKAPALHSAGKSFLAVSEPDGMNTFEVHRIDPIPGQPMAMQLVGSFPTGTELRGVQGRRGFGAFIASTGSDELWVSTRGGVHEPWLDSTNASELSSTSSLMSGHRIVLGVTTPTGVTQPAIACGNGVTVALPVPALPCRVLR